jgi:hypothetical protein
LEQLPEYAGGSAAAAKESAPEPTPAAATAEPAAPARKRGRPPKRKAEPDEDESAAAPVPVEQPATSRQRASSAASSAAPVAAEDAESTVSGATAASRKSKKSKLSQAASKKASLAPAESNVEEEQEAAPRDKITKRGRRPKRVTTSSELPSSPAAAARESLTAAAPAARAPSRRTSANAAQQPYPAPTAAAPPSPPRAAARPSMSARKRWSHAPVNILGTVVEPPPAVLAHASRLSQRWAMPQTHSPPALSFAQRSSPEVGSGGRGSGHGPTARASPALQEQYRAAHSRPSTVSPSRARALVETARASLSSPPPISNSTQRTAYSSAYSPSPAARLSSLPSPGLVLQPSPPAPLSSARINGPAEVASRLSFSQFSPEKVAAAAAASSHRANLSPVRKLPQTLFKSDAYHAPAGGAAAVAGSKRPMTATAAAKSKQPAPSSRVPGAGAPSGSPPASSRFSLAATAGPGQLFSQNARANRLGVPTPAAGGPRGSPSAAASLNRKSLAATASASSLASLGRPGTAAAAAARPKFDLQESLSKPLGWNLKKGSVKQVEGAAVTSRAPAASTGAHTSRMAARVAELRSTQVPSTKPAQQVAQQAHSQAARNSKLQQAREKL